LPGLPVHSIQREIGGRWLSRVAAAFAVIVTLAWWSAPGIDRIVSSAAVATLDSSAFEWSQRQVGIRAMEALRGISLVHGTAVVLGLAALCAAWLWTTGERDATWRLLATVPGGMALNALVKLAVHRPRPAWGVADDQPSSYSFPSGHVVETVLLYGFVLLWVTARWPPGRQRLACATLAVAMVLLVAASRIALGMHHLSDCVAGLLEALAWLAICNPAAASAGARAVPIRESR
jgi:undecaprenyl-diphosphatase